MARYAYQITLQIEPNKRIKKKKKKKGRQGRSAEVRLRKLQEKKIQQETLVQCTSYSICKECQSESHFIEDYTSGDLICTNCGVVSEIGGIAFTSHQITPSPNQSKPYQTIVHFRQRISQLQCKDPEQDQDKVDLIHRYVLDHENELGDKQTYGIKTFSLICRKIGLNPKIASHWIQLRHRVLGEEYQIKIDLDETFLKRLSMRYVALSHCFKSALKRRKGEPQTSPLQRNNVINLNYSIIQLIRLEDDPEEHIFHYLAKYFPQLISHNQPELNNQRWEILMKKCEEKYFKTGFADPIKGDLYYFEWPYKPIEEEHLLKYFYYFY